MKLWTLVTQIRLFILKHKTWWLQILVPQRRLLLSAKKVGSSARHRTFVDSDDEYKQASAVGRSAPIGAGVVA